MDDTFTLVGQIIGKYRIIERLGRGGMAEVYKGYDENLERFVAIKVMHPFLASEEDFIRRFRREAKAMAALNHPNIVKVYDFDTAGSRSYIVMEYLSQGTLKDRQEELARKGQQLSLVEALQIVLQITDALAFAHSRGMIHRDIKPPNIMFNDHGAAILSDFGIAKVASVQSFTQTGAMIGSPAYMSPEQGLGKPGDERSDIYSLGVLFYQLVTGRLPYAADTPLAVVLKHVNEPVPDPSSLNPAIPAGIRSVITTAMAKDPDERYSTAKAMADALREVLRSGDPALANAMPAELLKEQPTPPPMSGLTPAQARITDSGTRQILDKTQAVVSERTVVATGSPTAVGTTPVATPIPAPVSGRKMPWVAIGVIALVLILVLAVVGGFIIGGQDGDDETPTPTEAIAVADDETPTVTSEDENIEDEATPTIELVVDDETPTLTPTPASTDAVATPTLIPTNTTTPDATLTQEAICAANPALLVSDYYTYSNTQNNSAPTGTTSMRLNFVLENNGSQGCTWPEQLQIVALEGEDFGMSEPFVFDAGLIPGDELLVTITGLDTPTRAGTVEATWQVQTLDGQPFGEPFEFEIVIYTPPTATPVATPTTAVVASPTTVAAAVDFNYFVISCEYPGGSGGSEYRCTMTITPYGGVGPYTVEVFDAPGGQATRYQSVPGNVNHYMNARRCASWIHEIKVIDEGSGQQATKNVFFDPTTTTLFPGGAGCVLPG